MSRYVKYCQETGAFGEGSGTPVGVKVTSVNSSFDRGVMLEETIDSYVYNDGYAGALKVTGSLEASLRPRQMETMIHALLGSATDGTGFTTYSLGEPIDGVLVVGDRNNGLIGTERKFAGVGFKSASFSFESKEFVKVTLDWIAQNYTDAAYSEPESYSDEAPVVFWRAGISVGGTPIASVKSMTLDIDRKLDEEQFTLGTYLINRLAMTGVTEIGGSLTLTEVEYSEFNRAIYGSTAGTSLPATNDLGKPEIIITLKDIAGNTSMTITLPVTIYSTGSYNLSGKAEGERTIDFTAVGSDIEFDIYDAQV